MIRDKLISAIQRDRLSDFLKEAYKQKSGCFYYSFLMSWEEINPRSVLPRNVVEKIMSLDDSFDVNPSDVVKKVSALRDILGLRVVRVQVPHWILQSSQGIRREFKIPNDIEVVKDDKTERIDKIDSNSSVIFYWQNKNEAHYTSIKDSHRFLGLETSKGNLGGQKGVDFIKKETDMNLILAFHLSKA